MTTVAAAALALAIVGAGEAQAPAAGTHTIDGKVTKVDAKKGWVDVKTPEGSMKLHFPPALDRVKTGDSVTVELGMSASASSETTTKTSKKTKGEVTRVDAKKGWVHVKTSDGTMIVHFPPSDLQTMKKGDRITVSLALKDNGPASK